MIAGTTNGYNVSFWGDDNVVKLNVVVVAQLYEYSTNSWACTL